MTSLWSRLLGRPPAELTPAAQRHLGLRSRLDLRQAFGDAELVAVDTELTGLDFRRDSLIAIGAVRLDGTRILPGKTFYRLVRPASELKHEGVVVHELTHSDLEDAAEPVRVLEEFLEFVGDRVIIGHFVQIEVNFIGRAMRQAFGISLQSPAVDTGALHDWLIDNDTRFAKHHGGVSLNKDLFSVAQRYGILVENTHNAFYDAFVTAQLFQKLAYFLPGCGVRTLKELLSVGKS